MLASCVNGAGVFLPCFIWPQGIQGMPRWYSLHQWQCVCVCGAVGWWIWDALQTEPTIATASPSQSWMQPALICLLKASGKWITCLLTFLLALFLQTQKCRTLLNLPQRSCGQMGEWRVGAKPGVWASRGPGLWQNTVHYTVHNKFVTKKICVSHSQPIQGCASTKALPSNALLFPSMLSEVSSLRVKTLTALRFLFNSPQHAFGE